MTEYDVQMFLATHVLRKAGFKNATQVEIALRRCGCVLVDGQRHSKYDPDVAVYEHKIKKMEAK